MSGSSGNGGMNNMMQMFGQMMFWPMTTMADMMSRSMQGMQGMGMQNMGTQGWGSSQGTSCAPCALPEPRREETITVSTRPGRDDWSCGTSGGNDWSCRGTGGNDWHGDSGTSCGCGCDSCNRGNCCGGSNCHHCGSNVIKLVEYSVVNIARGSGNENLRCRQMLIRDCTTQEEFNNCIIAEYAKEHPHVNCKNLRVYYKVLDCWCKRDWDYEETQIAVLEQIRDAIARDDRQQGAEQR
jgi:hypothetical protein